MDLSSPHLLFQHVAYAEGLDAMYVKQIVAIGAPHTYVQLSFILEVLQEIKLCA